MAGLKAPKDLTGEQYIAIEDSLLSSEAGRAFLRMRDRRAAIVGMDEYHAGLRSIRQWIEKSNQRSSEEVHLEVLRKELIEMASSIRKAKTEIWAMQPTDDGGPNSNRRINLATEELDAIVHATERATTDILNGAEHIMEVVARVRQGGLSMEADVIDNEATNILMACGFQDITGQRISKVVSTLRYLEERVDAMIRIWGTDEDKPSDLPISNVADTRPDAHLLNGPALHGGVDQSMVDQLLNGSFDSEPSKPAPEAKSEPKVDEDDWGLPVSPPPPPVEAKQPEKPASPPKHVPEVAVPSSGALDQSSIDSLFP